MKLNLLLEEKFEAGEVIKLKQDLKNEKMKTLPDWTKGTKVKVIGKIGEFTRHSALANFIKVKNLKTGANRVISPFALER